MIPQGLLKASLAPFVALAAASLAHADGDLLIAAVGENPVSNPNGFVNYGVAGGIAAYSIGARFCNPGDQDLIWTSGDGKEHGVFGHNVYRLKGRRFEQLGQSWLLHGFCALCTGGCGAGNQSGCAPAIRSGCADTYAASLMDGQNGGPKFTVLPTSGDHLHPDPNPAGSPVLRGRLQVAVPDADPAQNAGAKYWAEQMVVHYEDHQLGNAKNNVSWREISFGSAPNYKMSGASLLTHAGESALHGWQLEDPNVVIQSLINVDEAGPGVHGFYEVASRVWDNGDGTWDYSYAVFNQNSTQGAQTFLIPAGAGAGVTSRWFNDVDYHSGEPQDGTDWTVNQTASDIRFTCPESYAINPNANALNWGTVYSFGFTADTAPSPGVGELEMFEPGVGNSLTFPLEGPGAAQGSSGAAYCFPGAACPCGQAGAMDEGCPNTSGAGAKMIALGFPSFSADTLHFAISGVPGNKPGLILRGNSQIFQPISAGVLCTAGASMRSHVQVTTAGMTTFTHFAGAPFGSVANPSGVVTNFQYWYRDPAFPCGTGFNFSNANAILYSN